MKSEKGFTLIELLTVIGIISVLAALGIASFAVYKRSAAYGVANKTMHDARTTLEAGVTNIDDLPPAVAGYVQTVGGRLQDADAATLMPGMMLPKDLRFEVSYDPGCDNGACTSEFIQVNHCKADEFVRYVRFGDGLDVLLENMAGGGCG